MVIAAMIAARDKYAVINAIVSHCNVSALVILI